MKRKRECLKECLALRIKPNSALLAGSYSSELRLLPRASHTFNSRYCIVACRCQTAKSSVFVSMLHTPTAKTCGVLLSQTKKKNENNVNIERLTLISLSRPSRTLLSLATCCDLSFLKKSSDSLIALGGEGERKRDSRDRGRHKREGGW